MYEYIQIVVFVLMKNHLDQKKKIVHNYLIVQLELS